jgi:Protein of unknown function DUF2834
MKVKTLYLAFCLVGLALPYWEFIPWVMQHGLNLRLLIQELFGNRISAFFGMDVLVSAVVFLSFVRAERTRLRIRAWWLPVLAVFTVGVSLGLPLFLYLREVELDKSIPREVIASG